MRLWSLNLAVWIQRGRRTFIPNRSAVQIIFCLLSYERVTATARFHALGSAPCEQGRPQSPLGSSLFLLPRFLIINRGGPHEFRDPSSFVNFDRNPWTSTVICHTSAPFLAQRRVVSGPYGNQLEWRGQPLYCDFTRLQLVNANKNLVLESATEVLTTLTTKAFGAAESLRYLSSLPLTRGTMYVLGFG